MKKLLLISLLAIVSVALAKTETVFLDNNLHKSKIPSMSSKDKLDRLVKGKKYVISTETFEKDGVRYLVQYWRQGGVDLPPTTNVLKKIEGKVIDNPLRIEINELTPDANQTRHIKKNAQKAAKKDNKVFWNMVKDVIKAKEKSSTEMVEFYDSLLVVITNGVDATSARK